MRPVTGALLLVIVLAGCSSGVPGSKPAATARRPTVARTRAPETAAPTSASTAVALSPSAGTPRTTPAPPSTPRGVSSAPAPTGAPTPVPKTARPSATPTRSASATGDWIRFGYDPGRSGVNPSDSSISLGNVSRLHRLWTRHLPSDPDGSPILLRGLPFPGGQRDVLYATTRDGHLFALDARTGDVIWSRQPKGPRITTSSPVADLARRRVFAYGLDGRLHQYDAVTGREIRSGGWPVLITRMPRTEKESSDLNIAGGRLYATTSGYLGDAPPYQGHVVSVDEATGRSLAFNSLCSNVRHVLGPGECSAQRSGIWARAGAVVDAATGDVFVTTGNGPYDADRGGHDYGDSVLRLDSRTLRVLDSYTPSDYRTLDANDVDLGSTAPALLPRMPRSRTPLMLVQGGKDAKLRLINRQNMSGRGGPGHVGGELEIVDSGVCGIYTQPAVWTDPRGRVWLFVSGTCGLAGYQVLTDASGRSHLHLEWKTGDEEPTSPILAGGVLFVQLSGAVLAIDPTTGRHVWSSADSRAGGTIGDVHWQSPIVVGGRLYVCDESHDVTAYGLP